MSVPWSDWFNFSLMPAVQSTAQTRSAVSAVSQSAALGLTTQYLTPTKGLYRIGYYAQITTPASINSSLQITIGWLSGAVPQTLVEPAMTGNTIITYQSGVVMVVADANSTITTQTAYASNAAGMAYRLDVAVELVAVVS